MWRVIPLFALRLTPVSVNGNHHWLYAHQIAWRNYWMSFLQLVLSLDTSKDAFNSILPIVSFWPISQQNGSTEAQVCKNDLPWMSNNTFCSMSSTTNLLKNIFTTRGLRNQMSFPEAKRRNENKRNYKKGYWSGSKSVSHCSQLFFHVKNILLLSIYGFFRWVIRPMHPGRRVL